MTGTETHARLLERIDPLCERFEADLDGGKDPSIEAVLEGIEAPDRSALLRELIALEVFYAREHGLSPQAEHYHDRFPDDVTAVDDAFGQDAAEAPPIPTVAIAAGTTLGHYTIQREIGRGGMGVVYEARHEQLDRAVALKLLPQHARQHAQAEERFLREARAIAKLHHSSIVPVFDYGMLEGMHYFAMQLIEGESLAEATRRRRDTNADPMDDNVRRLRIRQVIQIARALQFAHDRGVVHRDVKPSNILLDNMGAAWLVDFGVAHTEESDLTTPDDLLGTVRYMPPDRFQGKTGPTDDVYSLGMTLLEALIQRPVFSETDPLLLMRAIVDRETPRLRDVQPGASRDLDTVLSAAMAQESRQRYASAGAFADDLERFLADLPVRARRVHPIERSWRWARRHRAAAVAIVALVMLALGGSITAFIVGKRNQRITELSADVGDLLTESEVARADLELELYRSDMQLGAQGIARSRGTAVAEKLGRWIPQAGERDVRGWEWHVLRSMLARDDDCRWAGSSGGKAVDAAAGMIAGAGSGTADVLDAETRDLIVQLGGFSHARSVRIHPTGKFLLVTGMRAFHVFSLPSGEKIASRPSPAYVAAEWVPGDLRALVMNPDPAVWDIEADTMRPLEALSGLTMGLDVSEDGRWAAATDGGGLLRVIDLESGAVVQEVQFAKEIQDTLREGFALSPDGRMVASTGRVELGIHVWSVATGERVMHADKAHLSAFSSLRWSPDSQRLVTSSTDSTVKVWDVATGACLRTLRGHTGNGRDACFARDGDLVVSTAWSGDIRFWDMTIPPGHSFFGEASSFDRPGHKLARWSDDDQSLRIADSDRVDHWDLGGQDPRLESTEGFYYPTPSPDGSLELRARLESLELIEIATGRNLFAGRTEAPFVQSMHARATNAARWSPDGRTLYISNREHGWVITDLLGEIRLEALTEDLSFVEFDVSSCGRYLALEDRRSLFILDAASRQELTRLDVPRDHKQWNPESRVSFDPLGHALAVTVGGTLHLFDAGTWEHVRTLQSYADSIDQIAWSPDGERIATANIDGAVRICDPKSGVMMTLSTPSMVRALAWDHSGRRLAAVSQNGGVHIWDASASLNAQETMQ